MEGGVTVRRERNLTKIVVMKINLVRRSTNRKIVNNLFAKFLMTECVA